MAFDAFGLDEAYDVFAGKPAVSQKKIESKTICY